jgi:hypothetical protein
MLRIISVPTSRSSSSLRHDVGEQVSQLHWWAASECHDANDLLFTADVVIIMVALCQPKFERATKYYAAECFVSRHIRIRI